MAISFNLSQRQASNFGTAYKAIIKSLQLTIRVTLATLPQLEETMLSGSMMNKLRKLHITSKDNFVIKPATVIESSQLSSNHKIPQFWQAVDGIKMYKLANNIGSHMGFASGRSHSNPRWPKDNWRRHRF